MSTHGNTRTHAQALKTHTTYTRRVLRLVPRPPFSPSTNACMSTWWLQRGLEQPSLQRLSSEFSLFERNMSSGSQHGNTCVEHIPWTLASCNMPNLEIRVMHFSLDSWSPMFHCHEPGTCTH